MTFAIRLQAQQLIMASEPGTKVFNGTDTADNDEHGLSRRRKDVWDDGLGEDDKDELGY